MCFWCFLVHFQFGWGCYWGQNLFLKPRPPFFLTHIINSNVAVRQAQHPNGQTAGTIVYNRDVWPHVIIVKTFQFDTINPLKEKLHIIDCCSVQYIYILILSGKYDFPTSTYICALLMATQI